MALINRDADRFEDALTGRHTSSDLAPLVAVARGTAELRFSLPSADREFVAALGERLREEAAGMQRTPVSAPTRPARREPHRPLVLVLGTGLPRRVLGAVASLLIVASLIGAASRGAVPGSALYPVKGWLDAIAVQIAGSHHDRGMTELSQAQEHISDARKLLDKSTIEPANVSEAFSDASSSLRAAQTDLLAAYSENHEPKSLLALVDFSTRARPQLEAMRPTVPGQAIPAYNDLLRLVGYVGSSANELLATCGAACGPATTGSVQSLGVPSLGPTAQAGGSAGTSTGAPGGSTPLGGLPGVTAGVTGGGVSVGVGGGGVSIGTSGASLGLPGVTLSSSTLLPSTSLSVPLTLPSLPLPSVGLSVSTTSTGLPGVTLNPDSLLAAPDSTASAPETTTAPTTGLTNLLK